MILEILLNILFGVIQLVLRFIPVMDLPAFISGGVTSFLTIVKTLEFFFPIGTLFLCITAVLAIDLFYVTVWVTNWLIHRIPFVG